MPKKLTMQEAAERIFALAEELGGGQVKAHPPGVMGLFPVLEFCGKRTDSPDLDYAVNSWSSAQKWMRWAAAEQKKELRAGELAWAAEERFPRLQAELQTAPKPRAWCPSFKPTPIRAARKWLKGFAEPNSSERVGLHGFDVSTEAGQVGPRTFDGETVAVATNGLSLGIVEVPGRIEPGRYVLPKGQPWGDDELGFINWRHAVSPPKKAVGYRAVFSAAQLQGMCRLAKNASARAGHGLVEPGGGRNAVRFEIGSAAPRMRPVDDLACAEVISDHAPTEQFGPFDPIAFHLDGSLVLPGLVDLAPTAPVLVQATAPLAPVWFQLEDGRQFIVMTIRP
ncbi:MAG: hypothetical protein GY871_04385 [Actinomycetales bacterium]|nr:hypothetical protein [Actinomycetales bacterium]